jgi:hypothetical protein
VKRECYTLCRFEGQTEEASGIRGSDTSKLARILPASDGHPRERMSNPRRLVPLSPERNRREVGRVGFHEQLVARHEAHQLFVSPLLERHDPAERYVPPSIECELGQAM